MKIHIDPRSFRIQMMGGDAESETTDEAADALVFVQFTDKTGIECVIGPLVGENWTNFKAAVNGEQPKPKADLAIVSQMPGPGAMASRIGAKPKR